MNEVKDLREAMDGDLRAAIAPFSHTRFIEGKLTSSEHEYTFRSDFGHTSDSFLVAQAKEAVVKVAARARSSQREAESAPRVRAHRSPSHRVVRTAQSSDIRRAAAALWGWSRTPPDAARASV
jgi:hypothetical protein